MMPTIFEFGRRVINGIATLVVVGVCLSVGCGPSGPDYPHATLEGNVTIDGVPVENGSVSFMPAAGTPGAPVAGKVTNGHYIADGVPIGAVTVTFTATKQVGMIEEPGREPYPDFRTIVPKRYSAGIPLEVTGGNDTEDFALTTTEPAP